MPVLVEISMEDRNGGSKPLHPLFQQKGHKLQEEPTKQDEEGNLLTESGKPKSSNKPSRAESSQAKKRQLELGPGLTQEEVMSLDTATSLDVDPNQSRRKKRKTVSIDGAASLVEQDTIEQGQIQESNSKDVRPGFSNDTSVQAESAFAALSDKIGRKKRVQKKAELEDEDEYIGKSSASSKTIGGRASTRSKPNVETQTPSESLPTPGSTPASTSDLPQSSKPVKNPIPNLEEELAASKKPTKFLQFNSKTGTIGSPPAKVVAQTALNKGKRLSKQPKEVPSRLVVFRYGEGTDYSPNFGEKIGQILSGIRLVNPPSLPTPLGTNIIDLTTTRERSNPHPKKAFHPLFVGKASKSATIEDPRPDAGGLSPKDRSQTNQTSPEKPVFRNATPTKPKASSFLLGGFKTSQKPKNTGTIEPAWPWRGMVHIRGHDSVTERDLPSQSLTTTIASAKRDKYSPIQIEQRENFLRSITRRLNSYIDTASKIDPDGYPPPPPCLRVPTKHYESGLKIQTRVREQLHKCLDNQDSITSSGNGIAVHPVLKRLYNSIATTFTAFDKGSCETQAWTQKYAPNTGSEVLHNSVEVQILKDWLLGLTVNSTEVKRPDSRRSSISKDNAKRKRMSKKLDGFVVSSDEEVEDFDEISEPEDDTSVPGHPNIKRTVFKTLNMGIVSKVILISGPHGCGKTAAVYAVAKELNFDIFEINAGSVRAGKDIMAKVGDMTKNHLVSIAPVLQSLPQFDGAADDRRRIDAAFAEDLETGRQGTMNSFFKAKPKRKEKPKSQDAGKEKKSEQPKQPFNVAKPAPTTELKPTASAKLDGFLGKKGDAKVPKEQKQSFILIEEADIVYGQDSAFWATIQNLQMISRRPIIITCNDESLIPKHESFHAILRFQPPPTDLAVDLLLLTAGCEGHVLQRNAVKTLYEHCGTDLRSALTNLNFWCQFAVGDVNRGLGWYISRKHGRKNVDEEGNPIRVVSEGTYQRGIGLISQDIAHGTTDGLDAEELLFHEAYDSSYLDLGDWQDTKFLSSRQSNSRSRSTDVHAGDRKRSLVVLRQFETFMSSMSDAEILSRGLFASETNVAVDSQQPEIRPREREDYILGYDMLLNAPLEVNYTSTGKDISMFIKTRIRAQVQYAPDTSSELKTASSSKPQLHAPNESQILDLITKKSPLSKDSESLNCKELRDALDPIATTEPKYVWSSTPNLETSQLDRTQRILTEDIAPYVRGIVRSDLKLAEERKKLSNLLSEGGKPGKRMRTTRAAFSALAGGERKSTRKERYFGDRLNAGQVLATGGENWGWLGEE